jgi:hypothetical protein
MWNFKTLSRPASYGYSPASFNRADGESSNSKSSLMMNAGIHKGVAVVVSGVTGGISAYKGLPEIKNFAGADILVGLGLGVWEFSRMYRGKFGKATAVIGGASTGLMCHWSAVQGTIWGATKSKAETASTTKGWDYENDNPHNQLEGDKRVKHERPRSEASTRGSGFDIYAGEV